LPASLPSATIFDQPPSGVFVTERRLKLPDEQRWTYVVPDVGRPIVGFEITVESVYPGTRYDDVAIADVRFPADPDELAAAGLALPPTPAPPGRLDEPWRMIVPPAGRGADIGARTMRAAWREPAPAHGPVSRRRSMETSIPNPPTYLNIEPKK
jgi:hypothetical protein